MGIVDLQCGDRSATADWIFYQLLSANPLFCCRIKSGQKVKLLMENDWIWAHTDLKFAYACPIQSIRLAYPQPHQSNLCKVGHNQSVRFVCIISRVCVHLDSSIKFRCTAHLLPVITGTDKITLNTVFKKQTIHYIRSIQHPPL